MRSKMQRYFIEEELTDKMNLNDKEIVHHAANVMRNHIGEQICLVSDGREVIYEITEISSDEIALSLSEEIIDNNELAIKVDAAIAFLKKDNFELSLQKLVELGVNGVKPIKFERNVVKLDGKWHKKSKRYEEILKSAAKQSRRNYIPTIDEPQTLKQLDVSEYDLVIVCYELEKDTSLYDLDQQITNSEKILFLIGPEGGISENEIELLNENEKTRVITLGKRILRAETAVISTMGNLAMLIEKGE